MDHDIVVWLADHRLAPLDVIATVLAAAGTGGLVWVAIGIVVALAGGGRMRVAIPVAATAWTADVVALGLRHLIDRTRPYESIPGVDSAVSFGGSGPGLPSGHAASSVAGAIIIGYFARRALPWLAILAAAIAASRVYAGLHYPTDVLAGAGLGAVFGLLGVAAVRWLVPHWGRS
jgi:undecaprenyl-diphosphatase